MKEGVLFSAVNGEASESKVAQPPARSPAEEAPKSLGPRVAIVSDQLLVRDALGALVETEFRPERTDVYDSVAAFKAADALPVDILLFDPPPDIELMAALEAMEPQARRSKAVLLLAGPNAATAYLARRHGFRSVLPKTSPPPVAAAALRLVAAGGEYFPCLDLEAPSGRDAKLMHPRLTRRQAEVLGELESGASNKEIARSLGISLPTVKLHMRALFDLAGARNRTDVVVRMRRAYVEIPPSASNLPPGRQAKRSA